MSREILLKFIWHCLVVLLPMPLLLLGLYLWLDPFMVVRDYDTYPRCDYIRAGINKGVVSLKHFEEFNDSMLFDSFILGSSVSIPFKCKVWSRLLPGDSHPMHFDASSESVHSLRLKIGYLKENAQTFKHALIVVPPCWFEFEPSHSPVYIDHYRIDPDISFIEYHWIFIKGFYDREFIKTYMYSKMCGKSVQVGTTPVLDTQPYTISSIDNEETIPAWEDSIRHHPRDFYRQRPIFSQPRVPHPSTAVMSLEQEEELRAISKLLDGVDYHIIVGPMLTKEFMDPTSSQKMVDIFGNYFHDFSQSMQWTADADTNYYDAIHYRHPIATMMLDSIYPSKK